MKIKRKQKGFKSQNRKSEKGKVGAGVGFDFWAGRHWHSDAGVTAEAASVVVAQPVVPTLMHCHLLDFLSGAKKRQRFGRHNRVHRWFFCLSKKKLATPIC